VSHHHPVPGQHPPLTTHRRLERGTVLRNGRSAAYRAIEAGAGEPHLIRDDFGGQPDGASRRSVLRRVFEQI